MSTPSVPWSDHSKYKFNPERGSVCFSDKTNSTVFINLVGQSAGIDQILEKVVTHPAVQGLLTQTMGPGYKLCDVGIRRAEPNGPGMGLHQDFTGEISLSILLTDTPTLAGTTIFVPKSHMCPLNIHQTVLDRLPLRWLRKVFGAATGAAGDMCFFVGRTFHGRYPHDAKGNIMISMDFFAVGARYYMKKTPRAVLDKIGPELRRLLDTETGLRYLDPKNGKVEVLPVPEYAAFVPHPTFKLILNGSVRLPMWSLWRVLQLISLLLSGRQAKKWLLYRYNALFNKKALLDASD